MTRNRLTVTGKRESSEEKNEATYCLCERTYGEFHRSFTLPEGASPEGAKAELKDGVLTISGISPKPEGPDVSTSGLRFAIQSSESSQP